MHIFYLHRCSRFLVQNYQYWNRRIFTKIIIFVKKYLIIEQLNNFLTREDDLNRDKNLATLLGVTPWESLLFL